MFFNHNICILFEISIEWVPMSLIDDESTLVHVMGWLSAVSQQDITWTTVDQTQLPYIWRHFVT